MAAFIQMIETETADVEAVNDLVKRWQDEQGGISPGYRRARVLTDRDRPDTYLIEVEFSSEEDAARNNERPETQEWAASLRQLVKRDPGYMNLIEHYSTGR